jgi:CRP/FNR family cyclic AMP-dependent transcriptional regulator
MPEASARGQEPVRLELVARGPRTSVDSCQGVVERFTDGQIIVREGDMSRDMYIIQRGRVEIVRRLRGRPVVLATLERGSFFGEMSLLDSQPRSAMVRAKGDTDLLVIEPGALLLKFRRDPTFAFEMLQHMSRRVHDLDDQLMSLLHDVEPLAVDTQTIRITSMMRVHTRESTE